MGFLRWLTRRNSENSNEESKNEKTPYEGKIHINRIRPDDDSLKSVHSFVAFDTETTGLESSVDRIVEIALLKFENGEIIDEYCTLVNPECHIKESASEINHIYDSDVQDAPRYPEVGQRVVDFLGDCILIGHNIDFDLSFIPALVASAHLDADVRWNCVDTLNIAKKAYPTMKNYKLQTLVDYLDISTDGAHRARADAIAAAKLFEHSIIDMQQDIDITIPNRIDDAPRAYLYSVKVQTTNESAVYQAAMAQQWRLTAQTVGDSIHVFSGKVDVGILNERADMMRDWLKRGDPYFMCIERFNDNRFLAKLAFYRDRRKGQENREQTVVCLVDWQSSAKQDAMIGLTAGEPLDLNDRRLSEGKVSVLYCGDSIGLLPSAVVKRMQNESAYGVWFEEMQFTDDGRQKPVVRIYW